MERSDKGASFVLAAAVLPSLLRTMRQGEEKPFGEAEDVVIPEGVTEIGGNAFDGCTNLTNISVAVFSDIGAVVQDMCKGIDREGLSPFPALLPTADNRPVSARGGPPSRRYSATPPCQQQNPPLRRAGDSFLGFQLRVKNIGFDIYSICFNAVV